MNKNTEKAFHLDLYSKNPYFLKLNKRINNKLQNLDEQKADLMINKVLGRDKVFNRDYAVFSYNYPAPLSLTPNRGNLHINPNIKLNIQSPSENAYPYKYQKKEFESDSFSNMYKNRNIKYLNSKFNKKNQEQKNQKVNVNSEEDKFLGVVSNENKKKNNENNILITNQNYKINN